MELPKLKKIDPNKVKKKKILLLSDDIRMFSGIATQGKEMVMGTVDTYDWVQIAGSIKHPDKGKAIDISNDVQKQTGVDDASVMLYPTDGYGNPDLLREIIAREQPDAILHFTDPRFWGWLYQMEHELRQEIPLMYLNIWDDLPDPKWNEPFYRSCDLLLAISKQTYGINSRVCNDYKDWQIQYVPHGPNVNTFYPIVDGTEEHTEMLNYKKQIFKDADPEFILMVSNRNIRRKNISDIIMAYKTFCDGLAPEDAQKCALYLHTQAVDNNGTDLFAVVEHCCPEYPVYISANHTDTVGLNYLYNIADVTINIASNEGFGLTTCEGLCAGTPTIVNVTGGLQDQCGFKLNGKPITAEQYVEFGSLHDKFKWLPKLGKELTHGPWVEPVWSRTRSLKGSVPTPFIFDDTVAYEDAANAIEYFYTIGKEKRQDFGAQGAEWVRSKESGLNHKHMSDRYKKAFEDTFTNWKPRKRFEMLDTILNEPKPKINLVNVGRQKPAPPKQAELKLPKLKKVNAQ
jgi:glycosyltransferase involved in cell wall biosynthesis